MGLLVSGFVIFLLSPKSIGFLMRAPNLDSQIPAPWLMASSAGVFWAVGLVVAVLKGDRGPLASQAR